MRSSTSRTNRNYEDRPRVGALALAVVVSHPRQSVATFMGMMGATVIIANALFFQAGQHPAPLFVTKQKVVTAPTPAVEPVPAPRPRVIEITPQIPAPAPAVPRSRADVVKGMRPAAELAPVPAATRNDPIAEMLAPPREIPAVQSSPPTGSKRLVSVQRALADFGYGQVKATGTMGPDTQAAIERFERDRKMPVTGQLSDRLVRELAVATGRPLD